MDEIRTETKGVAISMTSDPKWLGGGLGKR